MQIIGAASSLQPMPASRYDVAKQAGCSTREGEEPGEAGAERICVFVGFFASTLCRDLACIPLQLVCAGLHHGNLRHFSRLCVFVWGLHPVLPRSMYDRFEVCRPLLGVLI